MKKQIAGVIIFACILILAGCAAPQTPSGETPPQEQSDTTPTPADEALSPPGGGRLEPAVPGASPLPEGLPTVLARADSLDNSGGYLLLGEVPEADIALYCDNSEERDHAYLRRGEYFQAFEQDAWIDPTVLPELTWTDWDEDGEMDLVVDYLRHEGTIFDGKTSSPALVCEKVVYQWDGEQWTDLHFYSSGGRQTLE